MPGMDTATNHAPVRRASESFQGREMYRLAVFSVNELGFKGSSMIALDYVDRAMAALESAEELNRKTRQTAKELRERAARIKRDCEYLAVYHENREKFKGMPTTGAVEWTTKQAVRAVSRGHIVQFHDLLAHKIRRFHAEVSAILNEIAGMEFSFRTR